ncbi:MAG TPA: 2OG-Fe(II) oxygenase [Rhizomicrobium sp.]|jgi:PKHD-type hydroxylase|nr:2OG-Fe(II) oxygenase [Rhizomicrobium sp.]
MPDLNYYPTCTFAVVENAFSPAELAQIEAYGDRLTADKATVADIDRVGKVRDDIRVTRTAWLNPVPEVRWIYDRMQGVIRAINDRVYQFDLGGFSDNLQYTVYHGTEGGHYDWHVDHGSVLQSRRKLSITVQLSDPSDYEGCDLQFYAGNKPENAPRDRGLVIAFPSYVLHRVTPCTRGTRKAIVAWTTGPQFR